MAITQVEALRAYAKMMNTLSITPIENLLAEDFIYESQTVMQPLESKKAFLDYMVPKLQAIARFKATVYAEMGTVIAYGAEQPCVILAQNDKSNLVALAIAKVEDNKLKRLDLCIVPPPEAAERTGDYPV